MGLTDIPPPGAPWWLVHASTVCLGIGVGGWLIAYVLMTYRSLATRDTPVPLIPLGINLAWEAVYGVYVAETTLERAGFLLWLLLDLPVLYVTLRAAPRSFAQQPLVARNFALLLGVVFVLSLAGNAHFAAWWLAEPHRGHGDKWGKSWKGLEARDTTELAWWSAGFSQAAFSVGALAMLLQRGHSGGQSYAIWFFRSVGTQFGLTGSSLVLWWHWPDPHGYLFHPVSYIIIGSTLACDIAYPLILAYVRSTEKVLPDGTIVARDPDQADKTKTS